MKRAAQMVLLFASLYVICGCSGLNYNKQVKSWIGAPIDEVIKTWGTPSETKALKDGRRSYSWIETSEEYVDESDVHSEIKHYTCTTMIITDANGIVVEAKDAELPLFTDCWNFMSPRGRPGSMR